MQRRTMRKSAKWTALGVALAAAVAGWTLAQQAAPGAAPTASAPKRDAQAAYEPPSGPGAGQAFLKTFEGEWDVEKVFYPPNGNPIRSAGDCTQKMVQDGRFLESRFTFHQNGRTTTGVGVSGFDPQTGLFTTVWYDSRSTRMSIRQSRGPFDGKEIVLWSASLGGSHGQEHESKTLTRFEENGRRLVHRQYTNGPDGKERVMMELLMTRKS